MKSNDADGRGFRGQGGTAARRTQWAALILLALVIVFHLLNNWAWRASNEVVYGFDRMFHQVTSQAYYEILREDVNLRTVFAALTWSDYYPPLVHLVVAGAYKLFGVSMDVAAMSNSLFLVILLLSVYGIGERIGGAWTGLLSAVLVSAIPAIFAMSRYLYVDFALTSLVAANVCLLLRSDRFQHRGYALLYGLSLGLGMLVKWTFVAFVAAPLLVVFLSPGLPGEAWRALRPRGWRGRQLLAASVLGLGLTALWFLPNVEATANLPLGYALVPISWLLWTFAAYYILVPSGRGANLLGALGLGAAVASGWYLTKINFLGTFWLNAYGKPTGRSWGFGGYLEFLYGELLSPAGVALIVVAILGLVWSRWRRTGSGRKMLALGVDGWVLVAWVVVSFIVFSSQVSIVHARYIIPLLPPLGVAVALWLVRIRPSWLRALLVIVVLAGALFQFSALTFDAMDGVRAGVPFLADGEIIQLPSSGKTDVGYWVVPDVLQYVEEHRDTEATRLGILVNEHQMNSKHFIYLVYTDYPNVHIDELTPIGESQRVYSRLFESDWILTLDPAPRYPRRPDTTATMERLLEAPDDTFHRAFDLAQTYPWPDGRRVLLYQRRFPPAPDADLAYYEALMADLEKDAMMGDAVILVPPEQVYALARYGDGTLALYPFPSEPGSVSEADLADMTELATQHDLQWFVLGDVGTVDAGGVVGRWLVDACYLAGNTWYGSVQLVLCAPATSGVDDVPMQPSQATWEAGIALSGFRFVDGSLPLGRVMRIDLLWQAAEPIPDPYKVFVHLLDSSGQLVAQRDSEPLAGTRPTTSWQPGEIVADRYGLWLPADLAPGDYRLVAGFYRPDSGERLMVCCPTADAVTLAVVRVEEDRAQILTPGEN